MTFGDSLGLDSNLTTIDRSAFMNCSALTKIVIPSSVVFIGAYAFNGCSSLTSATFKNTSGWYVSNTTATGTNNIFSTNLMKASMAATYLKSTYVTYDWERMLLQG